MFATLRSGWGYLGESGRSRRSVVLTRSEHLFCQGRLLIAKPARTTPGQPKLQSPGPAPHLQGGLDHAPVSRQLLHGGLFGNRLPSKLISARSGDRGEDREVRDEKKIGKCPRASLHCIPLSVSYWHGLCEPRLVQVEQNNQRINTTLLSHYPIPLRNEIKKVKIPG